MLSAFVEKQQQSDNDFYNCIDRAPEISERGKSVALGIDMVICSTFVNKTLFVRSQSIFSQSLSAGKRSAIVPSSIGRQNLNDEELVRTELSRRLNLSHCCPSFRELTFTRKHYRLSFIRYLRRRRTTSSSVRSHIRLIATSVKVFSGASRDKASSAASVESNVTKNAKNCSTLIACNVSPP